MAAKIGSLRADLTLETGRFRAGAADARAQMASLKTNFKANSREIRAAANDMGVGVQSFARDLSSLKARLDPAAAATAQYRREVDLARKALDLGAISGKQYGQAVVMAGQKLAQIRAELKSVGDGSATKELSADMAALVARLAPAAASLASYRAEAKLLRQAQREGVISTQQFVAGMKEATANYRAAQTEIAAANGAARAGMQQLGMQINDAVTMYAMGAPLAQIFASQSGQATQAVQLMLGTSSKFGAFMAGPWGIAITAGIVVLSAMIPKLLDTEDAMKDVEQASDALGDAQSVLGQMFDLTTGKLEKQNTMLRLNAQIMAYNLRMQAATEKANFERTMGSFGRGSLGLSTGQKVLGAVGVDVTGAMGREGAVRQVAAQYRSDLAAAKTDKQRSAATSAAFKRAEGLDFSGLGVTRDQFLGAIRDGATFGDKQKISDAILDTLSSGKLDPMFKEDPKAKKPPKGKDPDKVDARYDSDMNRLSTERARLEAELSGSIESKYKAEIAAIDDDLDSFKSSTLANKDIGSARQQALILEATKNADLKRQIADAERTDALAAQALDLREKDLEMEMDQVQLRRDLSLSTKDQRDADLELLDLQDKLKIVQLDRIMATEAVSSAAWSNARAEKEALQASAGQRRQLAERQHETPGQRYVTDLRTTAANMNDAIEGIEVQGLQSFNDQLADAIVNFESLGDVAKNVLKQILADLIRLQIQRAIIAPIAKSLFGGASLLGGGSGSGFAAAGSFDFSAIPNISLAGARAAGGPIQGGLPYLVGERGPEIVVPGASGQVIPNHELAGLGGGIAEIVPSPYFSVVVRQQATEVAAPIGVAAAMQGRSAANSDAARAARRRIPGRG